MDTGKYCHLTIQPYLTEQRIFKEARALRDYCPETVIIAPGDGAESFRNGIRVVTYYAKSPLLRIIKSYYLALKMRTRVYHLHDPELLILGWCFRLFTSAAIIYDAHRPTFHYFMWRYGPGGFTTRFKATVLKFIEILGIVFIDGLIMASPRSKKGIGRFCQRKIFIPNFPETALVEAQPNNKGKFALVYRWVIEKQVDLELILESFFQVLLVQPDVRLILAGPKSSHLNSGLISRLRELRIESSTTFANLDDWFEQCGKNNIGLAVPNDDDYYRRGEQPEIYEFLAHGVPVICGRTPFTEAIVGDRETGLVLKILNPLNISEAVLKLFADNEKFHESRENARRLAAHEFSWSKQVNRLNQFYRSIFNR